MGWSNGSILSTSLLIRIPTVQSGERRCGDIEWFSDWRTWISRIVRRVLFWKIAVPRPDLYIKKSPVFKMDRIKAPVFDFHRKRKTATFRIAQSWTYFRTLQWHGKVPSEIVIFPGEPHGPRKLTHQLRKLEEKSPGSTNIFSRPKAFQRSAERSSPLEACSVARTYLKSNGYMAPK